MMQRLNNVCVFLILLYFNTTATQDCSSWWPWPWCSSSNTASTGTNWTTTTVPPMTTLQGSSCNCMLFAWGRNRRETLVAKLMEDAFVDITHAKATQTNAYKKPLGSNFDLVEYIHSHGKVSTLRDSFIHVRDGTFFNGDFFDDTYWYEKSLTYLRDSIHDLYLNPLSRELQRIAVKHGTSIGVFRAGETRTYDGICSKVEDQKDSTANGEAYLYEQQCQINLSYLIYFSLNIGCVKSNTFKTHVARKTERTFDEYMSLKDRRYVRSAVTSVSQTIGNSDIWLKLFYTSNGTIQDLRGYLRSMDPIQFHCDVFGKNPVSSTILLVNCTWYDNGNGSIACMPPEGNLSPTTSFQFPGSQPAMQTTGDPAANGNTAFQTGNTAVPNSVNFADSSSISQHYSSDFSLATSANSDTIQASVTTQSSIQSSLTLFTPSTLLSALFPTTPQTLTNPVNAQDSTCIAGRTSPSSIINTASELDSSTPTVSSITSSALPMESTVDVSISSTSSQQALENTNSASTVAPLSSSSNVTTGITTRAATTNKTVTSGYSVGNTTPFDDDPFFKAVVPVFTKKYNDEFLLRRVGTMSPVTSHNNFYWITIPTCICAILVAMLCLMCLQVDWLSVCTEKK